MDIFGGGGHYLAYHKHFKTSFLVYLYMIHTSYCTYVREYVLFFLTVVITGTLQPTFSSTSCISVAVVE